MRELQAEAAAAKKQCPDTYQRKNKIIPKYQAMFECLQALLDTETEQLR